jgi:hypothetical protein
MLDNGDVRVIQVAATDVMLRQVTPEAQLLRQVTPEAQLAKDACADNGNHVSLIEAGVPEAPEPSKCSPKTTKVASNSDIQALQALKYRCPASKLTAFLGIHFHIGELTIDADAASKILQGPCKRYSSSGRDGKIAHDGRPARRSTSKGSSTHKRLKSENFAKQVWSQCIAGIAVLCDAGS